VSITGSVVAGGSARRLALLMCDLVDSTRIVQQVGDQKAARLFAHHDRLARDLLARTDGLEIDKTDGFLLVFQNADAAVRFALGYHLALEELSREARCRIVARVGIHVGEVFLRENPPEDVQRGAKPLEVEGLAKPLTARLMSLASGAQTLLSREAFDEARGASGANRYADHDLTWLACGGYRLKGIDGEVEVYEVGIEGHAPLEPPGASAKARPLGAGDAILGWRPAAGQEVPSCPPWTLGHKLGEGGFGEVWLAEDPSSGEDRVFKFCFDAGRLRTLRREVALFRILREALGRREDIARILGWHVEEPPFYLEMEYTEGGDLGAWLEANGGSEGVPLATRIELAAQVAEALAAAHSVGVLHKDVKPSNVLVMEAEGGSPRIRLTDFGVGALADPAALNELHLTGIGMTELASDTSGSSGTLAYMAPELFEGSPPSPRTDVYALGVLTYQLVVGNLRRPMAPGWERHVEDELLREDIAAMVAGDPASRPADASEAARRLRNLDARREGRRQEAEAREAAERAQKELQRAHRRRRLLAIASSVLLVFAVSVGWQAWRAEREARRAERAAAASHEVSRFLVDLFEVADPTGGRGATITARELLDQGARKLDRELGDQPLTRARLQDTLGQVYLRLGLLQRAEPLLSSAEELLRKELGGDAPEHLESLRHLGELRTSQRRFEEAEPMLQEVLQSMETRPPSDPGRKQTIQALVELYTAQGRFDRAHELEQRLGKTVSPEGAKAERRLRRVATETTHRPFELLDSVPFSGRAEWSIMLDEDRNVVLAASAESVQRIDLSGVTPPTPLALAPGEEPVGMVPDGRLLVRTPKGLVFRWYNSTTQERMDRPLGVRTSPGDRIVISKDGSTLAVVSGRKVSVFRMEHTGSRRISHFPIAFEPEDKLLRVGRNHLVAVQDTGSKRRVVSWSLKNGSVLWEHGKDWHGRVQTLALDEIGGWVALGGWFDEVILLRLADGGVEERISLPGATYGLELWPDYPSLVISKVGRVAVWRRGQGIVASHEDAAGRFFLSGRGPATVIVTDRSSFRLLRFRYRSLHVKRLVPVAAHTIWTVTTDSDERCVFAGSEDGTIAAFDVDTDTLRTVRAHSQGVTALLFHDGRLVSASDDRTVASWQPDTLKELRRSQAHGYLVNALDFDPGSGLWSSSSDHTVRNWTWPGLEPATRVPVAASAAALWIRSEKGLGVVGDWEHGWTMLRKKDASWTAAERHRWEPAGVYRIVELPALRLVAILGVQPARLLLLDPESMTAVQLPLASGGQGWIELCSAHSLVAFGDNSLGLIQMERSGKRIRVVERWGAVGDTGTLSAGTLLPSRNLIVAGNGTGHLGFVALPALRAIPPSLDTVLELRKIPASWQ